MNKIFLNFYWSSTVFATTIEILENLKSGHKLNRNLP